MESPDRCKSTLQELIPPVIFEWEFELENGSLVLLQLRGQFGVFAQEPVWFFKFNVQKAEYRLAIFYVYFPP